MLWREFAGSTMHRTHHPDMVRRLLAYVRAPLSAALAVTLALVLTFSVALGQEQGTMVIQVPDPESLEPGATWADFGIDRLIVFAGETACADAVVPPEGNIEIILGAADQPEDCATDGAEVLFVNGRGQWLAASTRFTEGGTFVLDDLLAPRPPGTAYPEFICTTLVGEGLHVGGCEGGSAPGAEQAITWAFAPRGIFADPRVITAFATLIDTDAIGEAHAGAGVTLQYATADVLADATPEDAPLLLMAAGVVVTEGTLALEASRPCTIWIPHGDVNEGLLRDVATALASEFAGVLGTFELAVEPCEITDDLTSADILTWGAGQEPAPAPDGESFLASPARPGLQPGAGTGGNGPAPAPAGHGPAAFTEQPHLSAWDVIAILVALALAVGVARGTTRRTRA